MAFRQHEFEVFGPYALFSDPVMRVGGEKSSYPVPTYEAIRGICESIYWKPTIEWVVDDIRVMNPIVTEYKPVKTRIWTSDKYDLHYYMYLKDVRYQVRAHFEFNERQVNMDGDRNPVKHSQIFERALRSGGRYDVFLGTRECQGYVRPCVFGEDDSYYDDIPEIVFGNMLHGLTYPENAYSSQTENALTTRYWTPHMEHGIIHFIRPEDCPVQRKVRAMDINIFPNKEVV